MFEKPKSLSALVVAVIFIAAGTISVTAQTQPAADAPSANASANNNGPKKAEETAKSSAVPTEIPVSDAATEITPDSGVTKVVATTTGPAGATTKSAQKPAAAASTDGWHFQFTPYGWLASTSGTLAIGNLTANV